MFRRKLITNYLYNIVMKRLIASFFILFSGILMHAEVRMSNICSDGMVLQQNSEVSLWGTASSGAQITVTTSWNGASYRTKADSAGKWMVKVKTAKGSYKPYSITVKGDGGSIRINDVLMGEVWLASGQSNMQMPMCGFFNCPVEDAAEYICSAPAKDKVRMFSVPAKLSYQLEDDVQAQWKGAEPESVYWMSAVAYFYARKLNELLDIPVGIIAAAYGGARIETWTPKEILETYPDEDLSKEHIESLIHYHRPYMAYNAMLHPVKGYGIKGFIWYQGCSNVGKHDQFIERMSNMIGHWRECWNDADASLPFYMVELAPYRNKPQTGTPYFALLREVQHKAAKVLPNCGVVVTNDLVESYEQDNIHPAKKKEVGERLAYMALKRNYGFNRIACDSPEAVRCYRLENRCELAVELSNIDNGINRWMEIEGLEVAGDDGVFYPVTCVGLEQGSKALIIRSEFVPHPCEVRYGWGDYKPGNLKNVEGLPVAPFRIRSEN